MRDNCTVRRLSESEVIEYPRLKLFFFNGETYCVKILTFVLQHNSQKGEMKEMANQPGNQPVCVTWLKWSSLRTAHKFLSNSETYPLENFQLSALLMQTQVSQSSTK